MKVQATYEQSYSNLDSSESLAFIKSFTDILEAFFRARLPGFLGIQVNGLSDGSVVVDFTILLERDSNATTNVIVGALKDGNSTGKLGVVITGDIGIEEITDSSTTNIPRTSAVDKGNYSCYYS